MKKMITSIKTLAALLMAGAAFTACSSDNDMTAEQPVQPTEPQVYTMVIKASKGSDATTRALTLDGKKLYATWDEDEEVLVYQDGSKIGTLYAAASTDGETTLSGDLDSAPDTEKALTFYFHTNANPSYSGQNGLLATVASSYDFCAPATVAAGDFTVSGNEVSVPGGITFGANQQAVVKFTFLDKADGTTKLSPSTITASLDVDPSNPYASVISGQAAAKGITLPYEVDFTIPASTYTANGAGVVYLAIPDKLAAMSAYKEEYFAITITATVGDDTYTLTKEGFPFENGKYYEITAKMTKAPALLSEAIAFIGGQHAYTYSGTHFQVSGEVESEEGYFNVSSWESMVISATTGKNIVKVVFNYVWKANVDALTFSSGTFDGDATVNNVNATSLTVGSSDMGGTNFAGVTVYYHE